MPLKGTKALDVSKVTTVISTYVTELAVAPASGHVSVYVDLAAADRHRQVEVLARLRELMDYAREHNYSRSVATTTRYYYMLLSGAKKSIVSTTDRTDIAVGMIAIGVNTTVISGNRGSLILDSCFKEIIDWMREMGQLVPGSEEVIFDDDDAVTMDGEDATW